MDLADLKIFEAVARLGSMNQAALEVNTVQSNVTARIRLLEEELGLPLFNRTSKGVSLTPAGERLLPFARRFAVLEDEARRAARDDGTPGGPLVLGSLETTAALRLSPLLADFVRSYPGVELTLRTGTSRELVERVLGHELEGAFVCGPVNHPELSEEVMFHEELVLLSAPQVRSITEILEDREVRIVVLRAGCSYRLILEAMLARRGVVEVRPMEFGTLESIVSCVGAGLGITLLPRALIGAVWRDGQVAIHELPPNEGRVDTVFIRRREGYVSSAMTAFLERARAGLARVDAAE